MGRIIEETEKENQDNLLLLMKKLSIYLYGALSLPGKSVQTCQVLWPSLPTKDFLSSG